MGLRLNGLRDWRCAAGEIVGETTNEDLLDVISALASEGRRSQYQIVARSAYRSFFVAGDEDLGVVTLAGNNGGKTGIQDATKAWNLNQWAGGRLRIIEGTGVGQEANVVG